MIQRFRSFLPIGSIFMKRPQVFPTGPKCPPVWCTCLWLFKIKKEQRWPKEGSWHEKQGQKQSQSPESVTPNVRVRNPIGQSQSPLHTSTGRRETMNGRRKVSNKESVIPRKPGGGSRTPEENRKSTTKSRSPLAGKSRNPGENRTSTTKSQSPLKAGRRIKETMGKWSANSKINKQSFKEPKSNPKEPPNQH